VEIEVINFQGKVLDEITTAPNGKTLEEIVQFDPIEIKNLIPDSIKMKRF
jgi:beta-mannosidase